MPARTMWFTFARLALLALVAGGCGQRQLAVTLHVDDSGCALALPAGGSLLYQVSNGSTSGDGGAAQFCGGCLAVDSAISGADGLVAFLRRSAPGCGGVHPETLLGVRITGFAAPGCPPASVTFCVDGPTVLVPDGTRDGTLELALACHAQCAAVCTPMSCADAGKQCGPISDGCNHVVECGDCRPPLRCGGGGVANICGR
jgi:hypothetical protein